MISTECFWNEIVERERGYSRDGAALKAQSCRMSIGSWLSTMAVAFLTAVGAIVSITELSSLRDAADWPLS